MKTFAMAIRRVGVGRTRMKQCYMVVKDQML
ncbi:hypothetical protein ACHAXS_004577 [Conticribra weissflogii]